MAVAEQIQTQIPLGTWSIDKLHSSVGFEVVHNGLSTFRGGFEEFGGKVVATEDATEINGYGEVQSLVTGEEALDAHLQSPEFFDSERHSRVEFAARGLSVTDGRLGGTGELSIRGTSLPVELSGEVRGPLADAYGGERLAIDLETKIDRRSFGMDWQADLPDGGEVLANEVRLVARLELAKEA